MGKQTMTVRVSAETREALDAIATSFDRDRSYVVNEALASYVEMNRWQAEHIRQGLREAEAGKFVSRATARSIIGRLRRK